MMVETGQALKERLSRALLTQLHPGGKWNPVAERQGRKDLRRGPQYGATGLLPEPERGVSLPGVFEDA